MTKARQETDRRHRCLARVRAALVVALCASGALGAGCGIDEYYTGMGEGALPGEPLNPNTPVVSCDQDPVCVCQGGGGGGGDTTGGDITIDVDDLSGFAYRFDSLTLTAPLDGFMADQINQYFAEEIEAGALNILFVVRTDDRDARQLVADIGPGDASGAGHAFSGDSSELVCNLAGDGFTTAESAVLIFPNGLLDPPELPLREMKLSGTFPSGATTLVDGLLDAALTTEDAAGMTVAGLDFTAMLEGLGILPDLDLDSDGTNDAWRFQGSFTAAETTLVE